MYMKRPIYYRECFPGWWVLDTQVHNRKGDFGLVYLCLEVGKSFSCYFFFRFASGKKLCPGMVLWLGLRPLMWLNPWRPGDALRQAELQFFGSLLPNFWTCIFGPTSGVLDSISAQDWAYFICISSSCFSIRFLVGGRENTLYFYVLCVGNCSLAVSQALKCLECQAFQLEEKRPDEFERMTSLSKKSYTDKLHSTEAQTESAFSCALHGSKEFYGTVRVIWRQQETQSRCWCAEQKTKNLPQIWSNGCMRFAGWLDLWEKETKKKTD